MERKKILIVDDNNEICELIKEYLEMLDDFEVKTETNSTLALATIHAFKPDMIFLDIVMPETEGPEISLILLLENDTKDIPVIFLTGIVTDHDIDKRGGYLEGRPCLAKPITLKKLLACIQRHLRYPTDASSYRSDEPYSLNSVKMQKSAEFG